MPQLEMKEALNGITYMCQIRACGEINHLFRDDESGLVFNVESGCIGDVTVGQIRNSRNAMLEGAYDISGVMSVYESLFRQDDFAGHNGTTVGALGVLKLINDGPLNDREMIAAEVHFNEQEPAEEEIDEDYDGPLIHG